MSAPAYRFGEFRLDVASRVLLRGGRAVALPPKAFDCIVYLLERRERAVGRDELIAAVWGKVDVSDNVLGQVVARARRALGDAGEEQRVIRTVLRFGYQWMATVECEHGRGAERRAGAPRADAPGFGTAHGGLAHVAPPRAGGFGGHPAAGAAQARRGAALRLALGVGLAAAALAWLGVELRRTGATGPRDARAGGSSLVLPVETDAGGAQAWVRLGVMDAIAERLRAAGEPVVSSDNVVALLHQLGTEQPDAAQLAAIAAAAKATRVVAVRAELAGNVWHVALRLAPPSARLEAEAQSTDVLDAARRATDDLARALGRTPAPETAVGPTDAAATALRQAEAALLAQQPDRARDLLQQLGADERRRPEVRYELGYIDLLAGRIDSARATFRELLGAVSAEADPRLRARILYGLGGVSYLRHDYADVERANDSAIRLLAAADAPRELGRALLGRAIARSELERYDEALSDFAQARIALESAGDGLGAARADSNLGTLNANRDRFAEALPLLRDAADRLAAYGDLGAELRARSTGAYASSFLLEQVAALSDETRIRELLAQAADPQLRYSTELTLSEALDMNGRSREAEALLRRARDGAGAAADERFLLWIAAAESRRALRAGRLEDAARGAEAVLGAPDWPLEGAREGGRAWLTRVRAELRLNHAQAAAAAVEGARRWNARYDTPVTRTYAALVEAEHAARAGDADAAGAAYERALARADATRVPFDLLQVAASYVEYLIGRGDLARAGAVAGRVTAWAPRCYDAALLQVRLYRALGQASALRQALQQARGLAGERTIPDELLAETGAE